MLNTTGLLDPQKPHALKLLDSLYLNGVAADLSETGTGKTYSASWIAKTVKTPIVVIGPKGILHTWYKVLAKFGVKPTLSLGMEKLVRGNTPYLTYEKPKVGQFPPRYLSVKLNLPAGSLIILDEAHKCKGGTSLSAGMLIAAKRQGFKLLTLSATQATDPTEMKAFGFAANLHQLTDFTKFCIKLGAEQTEDKKSLIYDKENDTNKQLMGECHQSLFDIQQISSRLTRKDMGDLFADNQIVANAYNLGQNNPKIQSVYDEMEEEIASLEESTENYSGHIFAIIMKARRRSEMLKVPIFVEMMEDLYDEGHSVVSFLNFTETIIAIKDRLIAKRPLLAKKMGYFYGEIPHKVRHRYEEEFANDKLRLLICNLKCGGVSLSFHDLKGKYPRSSLLSPSFSAIDMYQALGRIHRQGGLTPCHQRIVYADCYPENYACQKIQYRLDNLSMLTDGDLTSGFKIF